MYNSCANIHIHTCVNVQCMLVYATNIVLYTRACINIHTCILHMHVQKYIHMSYACVYKNIIQMLFFSAIKSPGVGVGWQSFNENLTTDNAAGVS